MSVRVFVDGGWIGVESRIDETRQVTSLTSGEALALAADLVQAAVGDLIDSRLHGATVPLPVALRAARDLVADRLPETPNGTEFELVG